MKLKESYLRYTDVIKLFGIIIISIVLLMFIPGQFEVESMANISIIQLVFNILAVFIFARNGSIFTVSFLIFSWLFHCGQIVKLGFDIEGDVPLPFMNYGTAESFFKAFLFYYLSQTIITVSAIFSSSLFSFKKSLSFRMQFDAGKTAKYLILIGIIPRLYIDFSRLLGAMTSGYQGVYTLVMPQFIQSIAFFADAGVFFWIYSLKKNNMHVSYLFWGIVFYKALMVSSGGRQDAVCFLIVWALFYYLKIKRPSLKSLFIIVILSIVGLRFIDIVGNLRSEELSFGRIIHEFMYGKSNMFGDMLGEFGSAFCSLVVAVENVPQEVTYGMGRSYLAGIISIVPTLVSRIPFLNGTTVYTTLIDGTAYFGGSYLGEAYYNFSWCGLLICFLIGWLVGRCQKCLFEKSISESEFSMIWMAIIGIQLLLFTRGYFTDMIQRTVWLYIVVKLLNRNSIGAIVMNKMRRNHEENII